MSKHNLVRKLTLPHISASVFNLWLNRRQLDSRICFCIQSVGIWCFGWCTGRKSSLILICSQKREDNLIAFSDHFGYSSWRVYQNSTSGGYSKVSCNVDSETISMNISYSVTLKSTSLGLPWQCSGKTLPSTAGGVGSIPGWGAKIPHASWPKKKTKT